MRLWRGGGRGGGGEGGSKLDKETLAKATYGRLWRGSSLGTPKFTRSGQAAHTHTPSTPPSHHSQPVVQMP